MKLIFTVLFYLISFFSIKTFAQPGSLDQTFGNKGIAITDFYKHDDYGGGMAIQSDQKILLAGYSTDNLGKNYVSVCRYLKDGTLDTAFGKKGKVFSNSPNSAFIRSVAIQQDKKIVLGGGGKGVLLERLNYDGSIDSSFGLNGTVLYNTENNDYVISIKIQKDGKIITAGQAKIPNMFTLHRFNTDGSIDSTFANNGDVYIHLGDGNTPANDLVIQEDGKIVAGGFINVYKGDLIISHVALIRFNINGSIDSSFAKNGIDSVFINSPYDYGVYLALQKDQKILVSNFSHINNNYFFALLRFKENGGLDSSFGNNGLINTALSGNDYAYNVCVDTVGNIYQAGTASGYFGLAKFKNSGVLDSSFGNNGIIVTPIGNGNDFASTVAVESDTKILVGGYSQNDSGYDFTVARYNNNDILPIKLLNFTAQKQNNTTLLQWQTANEINNDHFSIERSADSKLFTSIGSKQATNNALFSKYSFVDNTPLTGLNYYRLKQVDKDGKFTYSKIVTVDFSSNNNVLFSISPNPAKNHIIITSSAAVSDAQIIITSATGRTLYSSKHSFTNGEQLNVPVSSFANQTLFITIISTNGKQEFKVVKE